VEHGGEAYPLSNEADNDLERHPGKSGFEGPSRLFFESESPLDSLRKEFFRTLFPDRFYRLAESCSPKNTSWRFLSGQRLSLLQYDRFNSSQF
jgi:hypothetical protein